MGQLTLLPPLRKTPPPSYRQLLIQNFPSPFLKSPKPWDDRKEDNDGAELEFTVTFSQKCCNLVGCIVATVLYMYLLVYSGHFWTIDLVLSVSLAEYCATSNEKLRRKGKGEDQNLNEKGGDISLAEKGDYFTTNNGRPNPKTDCLAAVVGYREDPVIFEKALESYLHADGCRFMLVAIDGNGLEDQQMVDVFQKVCLDSPGFS